MTAWDQRFLDLAEHIAGWSKDPSTKVGAVIVRPDRTILSVGYNGFPRGIEDSDERLEHRATKYALVVHAEANAILSAGSRADGCTIYTWPLPPCSACAGLVIQAGILRVVAPGPTPEQFERWGQSLGQASEMFDEAAVDQFWTEEVA